MLETPSKHGSARAERLGSSFAERTAAIRLRAAEPAQRLLLLSIGLAGALLLWLVSGAAAVRPENGRVGAAVPRLPATTARGVVVPMPPAVTRHALPSLAPDPDAECVLPVAGFRAVGERVAEVRLDGDVAGVSSVGVVEPEVVLHAGRNDVGGVVLRGCGIVRAVVAVDPEVPKEALSAVLRGSDGSEVGDGGQWVDGRLVHRFARVPPGRYDFELRLIGETDPLRRVVGVEVTSGAVCEDPRLRELDVRGMVHFVRVDVVGADDDAPLEKATIRLSDARTPGWRLTVRGAHAQLPSRGAARQVEVSAPGHVDRTLSIDGDTTVRLLATARVWLRLPPPAALPPGCHVEVRVGEVRRVEGGTVEIVARGDSIVSWPRLPTAVVGDRYGLRLPPGRHEVAVFVVAEDGRSVRVSSWPGRITVRDDAGEQSFELSVSAEAWQTAFAELAS